MVNALGGIGIVHNHWLIGPVTILIRMIGVENFGKQFMNIAPKDKNDGQFERNQREIGDHPQNVHFRMQPSEQRGFAIGQNTTSGRPMCAGDEQGIIIPAEFQYRHRGTAP